MWKSHLAQRHWVTCPDMTSCNWRQSNNNNINRSLTDVNLHEQMYSPSVKCHILGGVDHKKKKESGRLLEELIQASEGRAQCCQARANCWKYLCDDSFSDSNVSFCVKGERQAGRILWFDFFAACKIMRLNTSIQNSNRPSLDISWLWLPQHLC